MKGKTTKKDSTGVAKQKEFLRTTFYFKAILRIKGRVVSDYYKRKFAKKYNCSWDLVKIAIRLGYIIEEKSGVLSTFLGVFGGLGKMQIITIMEKNAQIKLGKLKLEDITIHAKHRIIEAQTTAKDSFKEEFEKTYKKSASPKTIKTEYQHLSADEKDYWIKLNYELHKTYSVSLEYLKDSVSGVVGFVKNRTTIADAVDFIGSAFSLKKIIRQGVYRGNVVETKNDEVNRPAHYTDGKIEVIDFIEDKKLGFSLGNAVKYISRAGKKDPAKTIQDLEKARWYLNREIETLKKLTDVRKTEKK